MTEVAVRGLVVMVGLLMIAAGVAIDGTGGFLVGMIGGACAMLAAVVGRRQEEP